MRKLIVSEFMSIDGVMQAPGGKDEDRDGGFEHGGWTMPYWHDEIGARFVELLSDVDALLLGRRTYGIHAEAFEPVPSADPFGPRRAARAEPRVSRGGRASRCLRKIPSATPRNPSSRGRSRSHAGGIRRSSATTSWTRFARSRWKVART